MSEPDGVVLHPWDWNVLKRYLASEDELVEHTLDGFCWCQPFVETSLTGDHLFIHRRSLDSPHIEVEP